LFYLLLVYEMALTDIYLPLFPAVPEFTPTFLEAAGVAGRVSKNKP